MMEMSRYKWCKPFVLLLFGGCAAAPATDARAVAEVAPAVKLELSSTTVPDGSLVLVRAFLPEAQTVKETELVGRFNHVEFPFFSVSAREFAAVIGVPYGLAPGQYPVRTQVRLLGGEVSAEGVLTVVEGKYASETLKVDPRRVSPKKKDLKRIQREIAEVGKIYATVTRTKFWDGPFDFPLKSSVTSIYGTKRVFNGIRQSYHSGMDFKAPVGTQVFAPAPGVVALTKDLFFSGKTILIDHGYGLFTMYAHLSKFRVKSGQKVSKGELLGLSGNTGRVSGPHLHWQVHTTKAKVNPMGLIETLK